MLLTDAAGKVSGNAGLLIDGEPVTQGHGGELEHIYAATGRPTCVVSLAGSEDVDAAVRSSRRASSEWRAVAPELRRDKLIALAELIQANAATLSALQTLESAMPQRFAATLPRAAADHLKYCAGWTDKLNGELAVVNGGNALDYTCREPFGVVGVILSWNAALPALGQLLGAILAGGNTVVLKPSELAPFTAYRIAELSLQVGIPRGVINVVPGTQEAGVALVQHPDVDKLHFTGSSKVAREVVAGAGKHLTPVCLELGGKAALIVFEDADLVAAAEQALSGMAFLSGQSCISCNRVLIHAAVYDQVVRLLRGFARRVRIGDPFDPATVMGPLISEAACARIIDTVGRAQEQGSGSVLMGGKRMNGELSDGYFIPPTLFGDVDPKSALAQEEIFGPVTCLFRFDNEAEAVSLANSTLYGLAAYVHTKDVRRAHRVSLALQAGNVWVNGMEPLPPSAPFGGTRLSGYGRLGGSAGIQEFTQTKNVWMAL